MKNPSIPSSLVLLLLLSSPALASEQLFGQLDQNQDGLLTADEINQQHRRLFDRLLRTADGDHDGRLTSSEFQVGLEPKQAEKPLVKKQSSEMPGANALLLLLAKMDADGNGQIEEDEVPDQFLEVFQRIEDRLGGERDGVLDRRELTQAAPMLSHVALRMAERMKLDVDVELAMLSEKQWNSVQNMLSRRGRSDVLADPKRAREFFKQLDTNGDGQITLAEVPDQVAERFDMLIERADRNRDDQISEQELMAVSRQMQSMAANRPSPGDLQKGAKRLLKQLDRDGDKLVSREEAPQRMKGRFDRLDADGSGQLDREELTIVVELLSRFRQSEAGPRSDSEAIPTR